MGARGTRSESQSSVVEGGEGRGEERKEMRERGVGEQGVECARDRGRGEEEIRIRG